MSILAAIPSGCAWCTGSARHPRWPDCDCRTECEAPQCLPGLPAADVQPGMAIWHPDGTGTGALAVLTVDGPDEDGFVRLSGPGGTGTVAADWRVTPYTAADADLAAFIMLAAQAEAEAA